MVRPFLALYAGGMGARGANFHFEVFARMGYEDVALKVQDLYLAGQEGRGRGGDPAVDGRGRRARRPTGQDPRRARHAGARRASRRSSSAGRSRCSRRTPSSSSADHRPTLGVNSARSRGVLGTRLDPRVNRPSPSHEHRQSPPPPTTRRSDWHRRRGAAPSRLPDDVARVVRLEHRHVDADARAARVHRRPHRFGDVGRPVRLRPARSAAAARRSPAACSPTSSRGRHG